ncbi:cytochrome c biogenesis protein CcdA [Xinfangfangia sp. CPCC 101601]|uniref:Cytochrome c biogenesis protein CcdA n=1 Tax=Pseudogemmobacter lacusdianii TaxID=3069608 RepID=A0ABU0VTK0_9RHOB|nr:cytochrome c biogenesis protein CcdA [Xinfangfangia sp. CPCC 101601]MDQ2065043.1 cytochrome c biogenesis protein CcdA [Xinfangfangia sp. CPCC 101601]
MLDISIIDAGLALATLLALLGGLLSFLSPCVLPVVPPYLAYISGVSVTEMTNEPAARRKILLPAVFFVMGLSTIFLLLGFSVSKLGIFFLTHQEWFNRIAGVIVITFGLHFLGVIRIPFLMREARIDAGDQGGSAFGAFILGLAFAAGWTPCNGPILSGILTMVAREADVSRGLYLMALYSVGMGLPFLLCALFITRAMGLMRRLRPHMRKIEIAMGGLLVLMGVLLFTSSLSVLSGWMLDAMERLGIPLLG